MTLHVSRRRGMQMRWSNSTAARRHTDIEVLCASSLLPHIFSSSSADLLCYNTLRLLFFCYVGFFFSLYPPFKVNIPFSLPRPRSHISSCYGLYLHDMSSLSLIILPSRFWFSTPSPPQDAGYSTTDVLIFISPHFFISHCTSTLVHLYIPPTRTRSCSYSHLDLVPCTAWHAHAEDISYMYYF